MPQPITSSTNAYALLHELNKSQLNIGEVQISGLCSRCSALGTLLTQEIVRPQSPIKKNKAKELSKQLNEISTAVNKHLVQQLPLIKKQMQQSLNAMMSVESPHQTSAGKSQNSTYIKTIDLLQENIVQITQRLNGAMERVLEVSNSTNSGSSDAGAAGGGVCAMAACVPKIKSRKDASFRLRAKSDIYLIPLSRSAQT